MKKKIKCLFTLSKFVISDKYWHTEQIFNTNIIGYIFLLKNEASSVLSDTHTLTSKTKTHLGHNCVNKNSAKHALQNKINKSILKPKYR